MSQKTTAGALALRNLDSRIGARERDLSASPDDLSLRAGLVELLLTRSQFTGSFDDFDAIARVSEGAPDELPGDPRSFSLRARYRAAVHRFDDAIADLARAEALGAEVAPARASIHIAQGSHLDEALEVSRGLAETKPSFQNLTRWAAAEAALGHFERADERYLAALAGYRNVSPFPVAFAMFQRGVMWAEMANQPERALPLYAEAVRRLPQYVVANVHLAELEAERGHEAAAIERLEWIAELTLDPEPASLLGELLSKSEATQSAARGLIARAAAGYEKLLKRHRSAFLDHGAEFFAGPGANPARAVELSRENLELRQTGRAFIVAIEAALAAHDTSLVCSYLSRATGAGKANENLRILLEAESQRCAN